MKNKIISIGALFFVCMAVVATPAAAWAQTVTYQPRTQAEMVAYLYGRIAMLLEIKASLAANGSLSTQQVDALGGYVTIETKSASDANETDAVLRGEAIVYGKGEAYVWFEYGRDIDFLDFKTSNVTVDSLYDRAVRTQVTGLKSDERYYYRAVAMDTKTRVVSYGNIASFRTDEEDDK
jgi:hypothetical protein